MQSREVEREAGGKHCFYLFFVEIFADSDSVSISFRKMYLSDNELVTTSRYLSFDVATYCKKQVYELNESTIHWE